jgi:hypothetical protein
MKKVDLIVSIWGWCLVASIVLLCFGQIFWASMFLLTAICIACGSPKWFAWCCDTLYQTDLKPDVNSVLIKSENLQNINDAPITVEGTVVKNKDDKTEKKEFVEKKETINCSCGCDALMVATDNEFLDGMVELAFWKYGHDNHRGFKNKCRNIWQMIRYGHPYSDMVILDKAGVEKLIKFLENSKNEY